MVNYNCGNCFENTKKAHSKHALQPIKQGSLRMMYHAGRWKEESVSRGIKPSYFNKQVSFMYWTNQFLGNFSFLKVLSPTRILSVPTRRSLSLYTSIILSMTTYCVITE